MAGYSDFSMSNNAVNAYNHGCYPLSRIKLADLKEYGIGISLSFFKWLVDQNYISSTEWHHTSVKYNKTYFYNLEYIREEILPTLELVELQKSYKETTKKIEDPRKSVYCIAKITYEEWVGSQKYGKYKIYNNYCIVKDMNWAYTKYGKKNIYGNHIVKLEFFNKKPNDLMDEELCLILKDLKILKKDLNKKKHETFEGNIYWKYK